MSETTGAPVQCPLIVLRVGVSEATGDEVADSIRDGFLTHYYQSGATHAIVDMSAVTYLSSVAIGPLLSLRRSVKERSGRLVLCGMSSDIEGVFHATKLIGVAPGVAATFEYQANVLDAVRSLVG